MGAIVLLLLAAVLTGVACYNFICVGKDIPTGQTSKMMILSGRREGSRKEMLGDVYISKVASMFSGMIRLDPLKRSELENALHLSGINQTPETYVASAAARGLLIILAFIPVAIISPLFMILGIALGCLMGFVKYQEVIDFMKKRKKRIEAEIPRFAAAISQGLETDRDILRMFTTYRNVAEKDFAEELDRTIADMRTGNYEKALYQLEKRIGSPMMSEVVRGLLGTLRGDDQRVFFKMICFDMRQVEQANLKKEALKRPRAMQKYSMFMMICILLIYIVVLVTEVVSSIGVLF